MTRKIIALCILFLSSPSLSAVGALDVGTANVTAYGGMIPTYFYKKDDFRIRSGTTNVRTQIFSFHDHFRFPFMFGASAGYSFTENLDINLSIDYHTARGKSHRHLGNANAAASATNPTFNLTAGTFGSFGAYIGARYYIDVGSCWYPFIGARAGVQMRRATHLRSEIDDTIIVDRGPFIERRTAPAGGISFGFDGPLTEYVNIFLMTEINLSGELTTGKNAPHYFRSRFLRTHPLVLGLRFRAD